MKTFSEQVIIEAPIEIVWDVLADIGTIDRWNPGVLKSSNTTSGRVGIGACRRCELGGKNYLEEKIVEWQPKTTLTMRITATNLPFASADIRFFLAERNDKTTVTVSPVYKLKFGFLGNLLDRLVVRSQYRKGMVNLLIGMKQYVEQQSSKKNLR